MNADKATPSKGKREYRQPKLRVIELVADEVLAAGCKTSTGTQIWGASDGCLAGDQCFNIAS